MKKQKRFLKLDYTTVVVVATVSLFLVSIGFFAVRKTQIHLRKTNDHKQPLVITNLPYCNGEKLDLTVPNVDKPAPLLIYVHSGGWEYGSKVTDDIEFLKFLEQNGFAIASINYRLSRSAKFPAAVHDTLCAVRFFKAHHLLLNIDPGRIALVGYSSGGNVAALAALGSNNQEFLDSNYQEYDSNVQALITFAAHLDLGASDFTNTTEDHIAFWLNNESERQRANPVNYLDKNDPPTLIFHALDDKKVPYSQVESFKRSAATKDYSVSVVPVKNGGHSFSSWFKRDSPDESERVRIIEAFLFEQFNK